MAKKLAYQKGFLLYHSSHGPCRVKEIIKETRSGKEQYYYSLESKQPRFRGAKFLIDSEQVETSGFHPAISAKEANQLLDYLKTSDPKDSQPSENQAKLILSLIQENSPWAFARVLSIFAREKDGKGAKGKRDMLARAVKGLIFELSFALEIPEEEALLKMKKSLKSSSKINSWVIDTMTNSLVPV